MAGHPDALDTRARHRTTRDLGHRFGSSTAPDRSARAGDAAARFVSTDDKLWLDFGNGQHDGQAVLGHLAPETYQGSIWLPHIIDLYPDMQDDPNDGPSCSAAEAIRQQAFGVNSALVANAFATLIWPLFRKGSIDRHGLFMDVAQGSVNPLHIDPIAWNLMGYSPASGPDHALTA